MIPRLPDLAIAAVLAYCFAAAGDLLLNRRSATLLDWNRSFAIGLCLAATMLFPLSVILRDHALSALATALVLCGIIRIAVAVMGHRRSPATVKSAAGGYLARLRQADWISVLLIALAVALTLQFTVENLRVSYEWDGFQIWATKAMLLLRHGALDREMLVPGDSDRIALYPPMVPMYEALLALFRRAFEWEALKAVFPFFFASMLLSTYSASRTLLSRRIALAVTAGLAALPGLASGTNLEGYADMPQAAIAAAALAALLMAAQQPAAGLRAPAAWLTGGLLTVKSEGSILFIATCLAVALLWIHRGPAEFVTRLRRYWRPLAVVAACAALRSMYLAWISFQDTEFGPFDRAHFERAKSLLIDVPRVCVVYLADISKWGLIWPAVCVAAVILTITGTRIERTLLTAVLLAMAAQVAVFYFTNWPYQDHIFLAYDRLLAQISPAALVVIGVAYERLAGRTSAVAAKLDPG